MSVLTIILAGGRGKSLSVLTERRSKPAVPIAGKYRLIDFVLSNVVNSQLNRIAVLVHYSAYSLIEYLGTGEPWGLNEQNNAALHIWQPYRGRTDSNVYLGTADAVYQNRDFIAEEGSDMVLVLSGDQFCPQDYREMIRFHQEKGADLTISTIQVPIQEAHRFGVMEIDANDRITKFDEKIAKPKSTLASTGNYVFNTAFLLKMLQMDSYETTSSRDFGKDVIPMIVEMQRAFAFPFHGYWTDIGTVETYWQFNMDLLTRPPKINLHDPNWVIHTRQEEQPSAVVTNQGEIENSLISDGCEIQGQVIHSVLSPGVRVEHGAIVRDSIILDHTTIHAGAVVDRCVIDQEVEIGQNAHLGFGEDNTPNHEDPYILDQKITVVGKQTGIPAGAIIGRNCRIDFGVTPNELGSLVVPSGSTIHKQKPT